MQPNRVPAVLLAGLALLAPLVAATAPDVRQNTTCHVVAAVSGCATATLVGTLVSCTPAVCRADFTLDLEVAGVGFCAATAATLFPSTLAECDGATEATPAAASVSFPPGGSVVVDGLTCVGLAVGPQTCGLWRETFTF